MSSKEYDVETYLFAAINLIGLVGYVIWVMFFYK